MDCGNSRKLPCPSCGQGDIDRVVDSRPYRISDDAGPFSGVDTIKRTRRCDICGTRHVTFEIPAAAVSKAEKSIINGIMHKLFGMMPKD